MRIYTGENCKNVKRENIFPVNSSFVVNVPKVVSPKSENKTKHLLQGGSRKLMNT